MQLSEMFDLMFVCLKGYANLKRILQFNCDLHTHSLGSSFSLTSATKGSIQDKEMQEDKIA